MLSRAKARARGFTLVEVLVALFIMAVMAVAAWQGVDGMLRTRNASEARLEQTLRLSTVLAQWEQDLLSVQDTGSVPALTFDGAAMRLTRRTAAGMQIVVWSLRPGPEGGSLLRWAGPAVTGGRELQEGWLQAQQFQGTERGQLATLTGITQWQLYFFRGNAWTNPQSSGNVFVPLSDTTAGGTRQALPSGVRLGLSFAPGSGLNGTLTRDILMGPQLP